MATMNDIAKAAGVSRGTVSNVLNGRGCVSYEKIRMVEDAAARLGYSLDKRASTLRKGVSGSIALIIRKKIQRYLHGRPGSGQRI